MSISSEIQRINTNIANAYTVAENKGATLPQVQNSANLAETISSIQTGGGTPVSVEEKDVNFYDYDGTRLYSYTLAEVQALTELPELPSHDGLICQGWNWTLANIKAEEKETDVGAMYITDDGKTRLYIEISEEGRMTVPLCFKQSVAYGVELNWGDGSATETYRYGSSTNITVSHTYSAIGKYMITLNPIDDCILTLGANWSTYCIMGNYNNNTRVYMNMLYKAELGRNLGDIKGYAFIGCKSLTTITMPNSITGIGNYAFQYCYALKSLVVASATTNIGNYAFQNDNALEKLILSNNITTINTNVCSSCVSLKNITIPNKVTSIGSGAFYYCILSKIIIPSATTTIGSGAFQTCNNLAKIILHNNITSIGNYAFQDCYALSNIVMPNKTNSISSSLFQNCYGMSFYDFSEYTSIPTLSNTNAFTNIPSDCKIIVPDSLYTNWIGATNWSTYASYIIKKSDWDAL